MGGRCTRSEHRQSGAGKSDTQEPPEAVHSIRPRGSSGAPRWKIYLAVGPLGRSTGVLESHAGRCSQNSGKDADRRIRDSVRQTPVRKPQALISWYPLLAACLPICQAAYFLSGPSPSPISPSVPAPSSAAKRPIRSGSVPLPGVTSLRRSICQEPKVRRQHVEADLPPFGLSTFNSDGSGRGLRMVSSFSSNFPERVQR
jgi:hypothetical protein